MLWCEYGRGADLGRRRGVARRPQAGVLQLLQTERLSDSERGSEAADQMGSHRRQ